MKKPILKSNRTQSYIEFPTRVGNLRFGSEENKLFIEINEERIYITDTTMNLLVEKVLTITGNLSVDNLIEKTAAAGITIDGVLLKDSQVTTDVINEKTGAAGVTIDGVLFKDGKVGKIGTHVATSDGLTTGQLTGADQFVTITSAGANNIISLPKGATTPIGTIIRGMINATGCELRVHPDDAASVKINDITTSVEAAIPADTSIVVELISATEWILTATTKLGAVVTAIVPDAIA